MKPKAHLPPCSCTTARRSASRSGCSAPPCFRHMCGGCISPPTPCWRTRCTTCTSRGTPATRRGTAVMAGRRCRPRPRRRRRLQQLSRVSGRVWAAAPANTCTVQCGALLSVAEWTCAIAAAPVARRGNGDCQQFTACSGQSCSRQVNAAPKFLQNYCHSLLRNTLEQASNS